MMEFVKTFLPFILVFYIWINDGRAQEENFCHGLSSEKSSCGQCIKINPQCAWCTDTNFEGEFRCDTEQNLLAANCNQQFIYSPRSKIDKPLDRPVGGHTHTQLQPQQVLIQMRPGETVSFPLKYVHASAENRNAILLNSETESKGLALSYSSDCLGKPTEGKTCSGLRPSDRVTFNVSVTLKECATTGDAVVSVGAAGVRDVVGLYVTPLCGCECEKIENHEQRSQHCHGWGNLVCGTCVCIDNRGGKNCDCEPTEETCRASPEEPVCSGLGTCDCGKCKCNTPDLHKGQFCECDVTSCPIYNGIMCAGHGQCECGKCVCDHEWSGQICECHNSRTNCFAAEEGKSAECNGNGVCRCNKCECNEGFDGDLCDSHYEDDRLTEEPSATGGPPRSTFQTTPPEAGPKPSSANSQFHFNFILILFIVMKTLTSL